ncbi:ABC transporter ATP-binding protein [Streptomyces zhihengii]|uniref:ABC transporter ATP-binding protein n=1 Tax=Streptomyces zhihengii TaxID=1818004 RepID=A0ABS2V4B6_9ACTN|nr:ABC transporter ATP-binding protein [Streptomyces zhihengii]MBM9624168.1 ABC transporter ATP-binding protein [Streptomyces zhihengii]
MSTDSALQSGRTTVLVEADGLRKVHVPRRGGAAVEAVAGVSFSVARGEVFGMLGPNGAGKSTTMRMVAAVSPVSGGRLRIFGLDPERGGARIRARIGVVPQDDTLDMELTVRENLLVYGRYFGLRRQVIRERTDHLLEFARLTEKAGDQVEALSGGMRRRLTIARSLINSPEILLLDEPTTGLDPQARHMLWERLFRLKQEGVTLLLTTHYMDEAEQLCDRLVVMDRGRIVAEGTPAGLIRAHVTREVLEMRFPVGEQPSPDVLADGGRLEVLPDRVLVYAEDGETALAAVHRRGVRPLTALVRRAGLEDVFLSLTGRTLVD